MLPILLAGILFIFLLAGSAVFLLCLPMPRTRQFALSSALWFAIWGPCLVALIVVGGTGIVMTAFIAKLVHVPTPNAPRLISFLGWGYLIFGILVTTAVATGTAWIHQVLVKRLTFTLFRLYAAAVCAGIGSVFGWCWGWWITVSGWALRAGFLWMIWAVGMLLLVSGFSTMAYKGARALRGSAPKGFTWISEEEFSGLRG